MGVKKNIKLLDCTIRDGGLVTDSYFSDEFVKEALRACDAAGIDYFEIGFKDSKKIFPPEKFGKWRFCEDSDISEMLAQTKTKIKIAVLADAEKCDWKDFKKIKEVSMVRCAFYEHQSAAAMDIANACADKGFETALCMMAASTLSQETLDSRLSEFAKSSASVIYLMDSFGALIPHQTKILARKYADYAHGAGKLFGIHCHNNLQCAFANTLAAIGEGADFADCTLGGLGKGAGNCLTEMLASYFCGSCNPRPLLEFAQTRLARLRKKYRWGFRIPYMLTGLENAHPRPAMEFEKSANRENICAFYDLFSNKP